MVKANEIRIGNIIDRGDYICKVIKIDQEGLITEPLNYKGERFVVQEVNPIPLTAEILEDAGFKRRNNKSCYSSNDTKCYLYFELDLKPVIEISGGGEINPPCKYLHQLQNLYYALTGEELELSIPSIN